MLSRGAYALALHPWNESVLRSVPLVREHGISPIIPLLGQIFDAHTVTEDWFDPVGSIIQSTARLVQPRKLRMKPQLLEVRANFLRSLGPVLDILHVPEHFYPQF